MAFNNKYMKKIKRYLKRTTTLDIIKSLRHGWGADRICLTQASIYLKEQTSWGGLRHKRSPISRITKKTSQERIQFRHISCWLKHQLRQPRWFYNLFVDRNAWRAFSIYGHLNRSNKLPKVSHRTQERAEKTAKRMQDGKFDLEDFLSTMKQIKKLGPLEKIIGMLPQARKMGLNNISINPKDLAHVEAIILSMTPKERRNPDILKATRKQRIAKGSGRSVEEVNRLLKQFEDMKQMMKQMGNGKMPNFPMK